MALSVCNFDVTPLSVEPLMELLKGLGPASVDNEFRNMAPDAGGSVEWMEYFMEFLLDQLKTNKNYELVQSYLGLFLKVRVKRILLNFALPPPQNIPIITNYQYPSKVCDIWLFSPGPFSMSTPHALITLISLI